PNDADFPPATESLRQCRRIRHDGPCRVERAVATVTTAGSGEGLDILLVDERQLMIPLPLELIPISPGGERRPELRRRYPFTDELAYQPLDRSDEVFRPPDLPAEDLATESPEDAAQDDGALEIIAWAKGGVTEPFRKFMENGEWRIKPSRDCVRRRKRVELVAEPALPEREEVSGSRKRLVRRPAPGRQKPVRGLLEEPARGGIDDELELGVNGRHRAHGKGDGSGARESGAGRCHTVCWGTDRDEGGYARCPGAGRGVSGTPGAMQKPPASRLRGMRERPAALALLLQFHLSLDHQLLQHPRDRERSPDRQLFASRQLPVLQPGADRALDLALGGDAEALEELADGEVEGFVVHGGAPSRGGSGASLRGVGGNIAKARTMRKRESVRSRPGAPHGNGAPRS